jgi:GH24 family phage-related lysozyme (muramidase)
MKGVVLLILLCVVNTNAKATTKKEMTLNKATKYIATRESFSPTCYKDGYDQKNKKWNYSLGYGTAKAGDKENWCDKHIKVLRWKNPTLIFKSDDYVRSLVVVDEKVARWKLKQYISTIYDNLYKHNPALVNELDEIEITAILSFIYCIGEKAFYNSTVYKVYLKEYTVGKKLHCVKFRNAYLKWSYAKDKKGFKFLEGAFNRRKSEFTLLIYGKCVF